MRNLLPNPKGELFFALVNVDVDYFLSFGLEILPPSKLVQATLDANVELLFTPIAMDVDDGVNQRKVLICWYLINVSETPCSSYTLTITRGCTQFIP